MAFDANDLTPHEHFVVERTRLGEVADFTPMAGPGGAKPEVRAGFLRKLLLGLDESWPVAAPGVRIKAARIAGSLDLSGCAGAGLPALALVECDIPETVDVSHARAGGLSLAGSRMRRLLAVDSEIHGECDLSGLAPLPGEAAEDYLIALMRSIRIDGDLNARGAKFSRTDSEDDIALLLQNATIAGNVMLDEGFEAFGSVCLRGAEIGGRLQACGAHLLNRSDDGAGVALDALDVRVKRGVSLSSGFKSEGKVAMSGARIGGDLELAGGVFRNDGAPALDLTNAEIGGRVLAEAKFAGQIVLQGASVARNLDLRGVEIAHRTTPRGDVFGVAVDAVSMSVGGAALLQGANIKGELFLADARVEGYLAFGGGRFINASGWAVRAPNLRVGGNLTFKLADNGYAPHGQKTVIEGGAKFDRARIQGAVAWSNLELRGPGPDGAKGAVFSFSDAAIEGSMQARALTCQQDARIDVSGASCAALDDDLKAGWGMEGAALDLDGFAYGRIDSAGEHWRQRLAWLKRSRGADQRFAPQPFSHAAQVYARSGRREGARRFSLAQHDLGARHASAGPFTWVLSSLFGFVAGYGLAPLRVARALALYLALGVVGVLAADAQGALVTPQGRACGGAVEPALYAIDVALPVVDLGQESRCAPGRTARAELPDGIELSPRSEWRAFEGVALWRWAHALYALCGAVLTALAVLTFSGVMKPRDQ